MGSSGVLGAYLSLKPVGREWSLELQRRHLAAPQNSSPLSSAGGSQGRGDHRSTRERIPFLRLKTLEACLLSLFMHSTFTLLAYPIGSTFKIFLDLKSSPVLLSVRVSLCTESTPCLPVLSQYPLNRTFPPLPCYSPHSSQHEPVKI